MAPGGAIFIFERINNMQFTGTFKPHPKGFGFVQTVEGLGIFVAPKLAKRFFTSMWFKQRLSKPRMNDGAPRA